MKKKMFLGVCVSVLLVFVVFVTTFSIKYFNNKFMVSGIQQSKVVGSKSVDGFLSKISAESINDLIDNADLIVIGKVITDGITAKKKLDFPNNQLKEKALGDVNSEIEFSVSRSEFEISEVLFGESKTNIITISQLGEAGNDNGETKIKKGNDMLLILKRHKDNKNMYSSISFEEGLFLTNNDKVVSLSDNISLSKYDGKNLYNLKKDIIKGIELKKQSN